MLTSESKRKRRYLVLEESLSLGEQLVCFSQAKICRPPVSLLFLEPSIVTASPRLRAIKIPEFHTSPIMAGA